MKLNFCLIALFLVLSIPSQYVNWTFSGAEPLYDFVSGDVLLWVGGGAALCALWIQSSLLVMFLLARGRLNKAWVLGVVWSGVSAFYMADVAVGALQDLERYAFK